MGRCSFKRAAVLMAVLAALPVLATGEDIAQQKQTAVRTALDKQGRTGDSQTLIDASQRASAITEVIMSGSPDAPEVTIKTDGRPAYEWFKLDSGKRIVIDFHNTIHLKSGLKLAPIGAAPVERVRSSLFALDPEFVSRVVVDLQAPAQPEFSQQDGQVTLRLRKSASREGAELSLSERALRVAGNLAQAQQQIASQRERAKEVVTRAAVPAISDSDSDALKSFAAKQQETDAAALAKFTREADAATTVFDTQRQRLDELQAGISVNTVEPDKAKTTLKSIEVEIKTATQKADAGFSAIQKEIKTASAARSKEYERLLADAKKSTEEPAKIVLAEAAKTPASAPSVEQVTVTPALDLRPDNAATEPVDAAIARIEKDLASLRGEPVPASLPLMKPVVEPEPVPAPAPAKPALDPAVLARLDSLNSDLQKLGATVEKQPAKSETPTQPESEMQTTAVVPMDLMKDNATVDLVNAAVQSSDIDGVGVIHIEEADLVEESEAAPIVLAQAEPTPEPAPAEPAPTEPAESAAPTDAAAPADANNDPAPPAEQPAPSQKPAPAAEPTPAPTAESAPAAPVVVEAPKPEPVQPPKIIAAPVPAEREQLPAGMDPLDQPVNIDFREMDLSSVVSLLAKKAQVNVIAGTDVTGTVTADIRNVPLRKAMDMVLRMNGLGIVEEEGIFRIVPYEEAVAARRTTKMVVLKNAQAEDLRTTLDGILLGGRDAKVVSVSANKSTNTLVISGPEERVAEFERLANELDVKEPTLPTITEAIKLNYLDPKAAKPILEAMKTDKVGKVEAEQEGRHVIVTDIPAVVEQMRTLVKSVDVPVKQVAINAMIVDAVLTDKSQTGVDWTVQALRRHSTNGDLVSDLSNLQMDGNLGNVGTEALDAGVLQLGLLSSDVRINATIAAEAASSNAQILASPSVVTVENQPATISIVQEFPYQEITQGLTGPPVASTNFKPIGVTLDVTPRITHENDTIVKIEAKQSSVSSVTDSGVPVEDKREAQTTLRAQNGRTIFIGGLRNVSNRLDVSKIPVLGDIPVLNFLFRNTTADKANTELLIFLTCNVLEENLPELNASQQEEYDKMDATPRVPDGQRAMFHDYAKPQDMRDPMWKWRRSNR